MSDEGARAPEPFNPDAPGDATADVGAPETAENLLEQRTSERDDMRDRWMRALAEMENLRRRTEREVADAKTYAVSSFARDMIGVADNMQRALETLPVEQRESVDPGIKSLLEGVDLTDRELSKALEKHGVRKLDPKGQKFDPNFHQAMFEIPDAAVPSGTVAQVVQIGYAIGDRCLRPALVGVSKGGPKVAANDDAPVK